MLLMESLTILRACQAACRASLEAQWSNFRERQSGVPVLGKEEVAFEELEALVGSF